MKLKKKWALCALVSVVLLGTGLQGCKSQDDTATVAPAPPASTTSSATSTPATTPATATAPVPPTAAGAPPAVQKTIQQDFSEGKK